MRTVLYERYGEPEEVLHAADVADLPSPQSDEVLLRVVARPIHPGDLIGVRGGYRSPGSTAQVAEGGARPGFEGVGVVEAVGSNVGADRELQPGTRVAFFPARWAWGEKVIAPARFVTPVPDGLSDAVASQLFVKPMTAALLVRAAASAGVQDAADGIVVQTAAGSGVGSVVTAMLARRRVRLINLVRSKSGADELARKFPDTPVIVTEDSDWREQLLNAAGETPIQVIFDAVGGHVASELLLMVANGGTLVSYGNLSGDPISVPGLAPSVRGIKISGVSVGGWAALPAETRKGDLAEALEIAKERPDLFQVAGEYKLDQVAEAVWATERERRGGAILLVS